MPDASTRPGPSAAGCTNLLKPRYSGQRLEVGVVERGEDVVGHGERHHGGEHREAAGHEERQVEAVVLEHGLADDRADADAAEHGHGEVAGRLGAALRRREVGDERGRGHEHGGLADAGDAAQQRAAAAAS